MTRESKSILNAVSLYYGFPKIRRLYYMKFSMICEFKDKIIHMARVY